METVKILDVRKENPSTNTLVLDIVLDSEPGQFVMVWLPSIGEKPFGISRLEGSIEITVKDVGPFTRELCKAKKGSFVGVRGPYGNGYELKGDSPCIIGGGVGLAPLMPIIERLGKKATVIQGVKTKNDILFTDRIEKSGASLHIATDDGSHGEKCFCHELFEKILLEKEFGQVYCCGPEIMMSEVMKISLAKKIPCQLSLERWMKCGFGLCGSCSLDPSGLLVCKDGPVFTAEQLQGTEFGSYARDSAGSKINI
ncbi:MAG: dihydroorotate dehydrogenase electron transfer subunit [Candidatus Altiarchaeota archaeon]|nr:dihydroorotate dehydrogenase electron transfer subunit [Candidatus Altiarchaeota archaeon]MBU4407000.1 dihydroorotate dehydrogenase electron transfer subunit [Candidatus Altiarchaeota archaeon]MBU4437630.1 dihydroorotate dehydrogenase electron transfer subunit [Candidatus Altiarchaeota archaeon]